MLLKAVTQTLGHLLKLGYYAVILLELDTTGAVSGWFYLLAIGAAVVGTRIGTHLLDQVGEASFRKVSGWVILSIATVCVISGAWQLASP